MEPHRPGLLPPVRLDGGQAARLCRDRRPRDPAVLQGSVRPPHRLLPVRDRAPAGRRRRDARPAGPGGGQVRPVREPSRAREQRPRPARSLRNGQDGPAAGDGRRRAVFDRIHRLPARDHGRSRPIPGRDLRLRLQDPALARHGLRPGDRGRRHASGARRGDGLRQHDPRQRRARAPRSARRGRPLLPRPGSAGRPTPEGPRRQEAGGRPGQAGSRASPPAVRLGCDHGLVRDVDGASLHGHGADARLAAGRSRSPGSRSAASTSTARWTGSWIGP